MLFILNDSSIIFSLLIYENTIKVIQFEYNKMADLNVIHFYNAFNSIGQKLFINKNSICWKNHFNDCNLKLKL